MGASSSSNIGCEINRSRDRRHSIFTSASLRSTCFPGLAPRTLSSLSMMTSTGSLRRVTPVMAPPPGGTTAPPAASSPFDAMVLLEERVRWAGGYCRGGAMNKRTASIWLVDGGGLWSRVMLRRRIANTSPRDSSLRFYFLLLFAVRRIVSYHCLLRHQGQRKEIL